MADEPKPGPKKDAPPPAVAPSGGDPFVEIVTLMVGAFFVLYVLNSIFTGIMSTGLFSHGLSGLTPQGIILNHTRPVASLLNPMNASVVALYDLSVYNNPDGSQVGTQKFNARGKILQGPVQINGINYYYVDFLSGKDGWVKESDIGYLISEPGLFERIIMWLFTIVSILRIISLLFCIFLVLFLTYIVRELTKIRVNTKALLYPPAPLTTEMFINPKWQKIENHAESQNENDWRLAIIEADIMLDELLDKLSLVGDTMGEKLKAVEKSDFLTIDNAWEAHKVRNQIAHEGSAFQLSQHETQRVIELYRQVFEEFKMV